METKASLLWVGPGMGELGQRLPWWSKAFVHLINQQGLELSQIRLIDILDEPLPFFGESWLQQHQATQELAREDFLRMDESRYWDIIIIDFIEAWLFHGKYWDPIKTTPYKAIRQAWTQKLVNLQPQQIWVCHEDFVESTIEPQMPLSEYQIVADSKIGFTHSNLWDEEALKIFKGPKYITIWEHR